MSQRTGQAREDQFLGALLGLAIGDAMGHSLLGLNPDEAMGRLDPLSYGNGDSAAPAGGEITDRTEVMLCLVESLTTNEGRPDPDNMVARMGFLARGPSREFMSEGTIKGIEGASERDGQVDAAYQPPAELSVAVRGVPIGLLHSVGGYDSEQMVREAVAVTRLSHAGEPQERLTIAVARAVAAAGRMREVPSDLIVTSDDLGAALQWIFEAIGRAESFSSGLREVLQQPMDLLSAGAIGGALLGARFGASGIPQSLIDDLDARIYLSLAAPWFYRAAVMRAGTVIDLRQIP